MTLAILSVGNHVGFADDSNEIDCDNPRGQISINTCASRRADEAKEEMMSIYKTTLNSADKERREKLEAYMKAWEMYSSTKCFLDVDIEMRGDFKGAPLGSMHGQLVTQCIEIMTRGLIAELESIPPMKDYGKRKE